MVSGLKAAPTGFCIQPLAIRIHSADRLVPSATSHVTAACKPGHQRQEFLAFLKQVANQYASDHVDDNACVMGNPHRSLTVSVVGSAENRDALFRIDAVFEDYINVSSTSIDFNRMDPVTQAWAIMIGEMLPVAEEMTEFTTMPQGMMKMTRDGILYVVKTYNNIQYLVASKRSVYALLGIPLN